MLLRILVGLLLISVNVLGACGVQNYSNLRSSLEKKQSLEDAIAESFENFINSVEGTRPVEQLIDLSVQSQMTFVRKLVSNRSKSDVNTGRCIVFIDESMNHESSIIDLTQFKMSKNRKVAYTKSKDMTVKDCQDLDLDLGEGTTTSFYVFY